MGSKNLTISQQKNSSINSNERVWEVTTLDSVATIIMGHSPDSDSYNREGNGIPLIQGNADIKKGRSAPRTYTTAPTKLCDIGDILLSVRAPVGAIAKSIHHACIGRGICAIRPYSIDAEFLYQYMSFLEVQWTKYEQGSTFTAINGDDIKKVKIPVPPRSEQIRIASILKTWDEKIEKTQETLRYSIAYRKALEQQLLSGARRFGKFVGRTNNKKTIVGKLPADWNVCTISSVTQKVKKSFEPEPEKTYREIGIRPHGKGIFHKDEISGKSLGNKSVFWVEPNCFVVNIVFAWEHAIAKTTEAEKGMIASHRFPMYKPKPDILDLDFLLYYFKTKRGKHLLGLASPGGAGRNKTLGQSEFAKLTIPIPFN